jgi:hypothetical protein
MNTLSEFQVDRQIFEAKFPLNYLFWDRAGKLWTALARSFPEMKFVLADPNHTQFEAGNFYLAAEPGTLRFTSKDGLPFDLFEKGAVNFYRIAVDVLEIELFDRLGFRTIWIKEFPSLAKAAEAFCEFNLLSVPDGNAFGIKESPVQMETRLIWEGDKVGAIMGLHAEKRRVDPQIPWEVRSRLKAASSEQYVLVLDVDYFTTMSLQRNQVDVGEWISSSRRVVQKALVKEVFK